MLEVRTSATSWMWRRQLQLHVGLLRYMRKRERTGGISIAHYISSSTYVFMQEACFATHSHAGEGPRRLDGGGGGGGGGTKKKEGEGGGVPRPNGGLRREALHAVYHRSDFPGSRCTLSSCRVCCAPVRSRTEELQARNGTVVSRFPLFREPSVNRGRTPGMCCLN